MSATSLIWSFFLIISPFYRWLYMYKERGLEKGLYFSISYVTGHKHKILKTHSAMKGLSNSKHFTKLKQKWPDGVSATRAHILVSSQSLYLSNIFGYDKSCVKFMESNYYSSNLKMFGGKSLYVLHDFLMKTMYVTVFYTFCIAFVFKVILFLNQSEVRSIFEHQFTGKQCDQ